MIGEWSQWGEIERRGFHKMPRRQGRETQTSRRYEASACWYITRVKLSLKPLIQLSEPNFFQTAREIAMFLRHPS